MPLLLIGVSPNTAPLDVEPPNVQPSQTYNWGVWMTWLCTVIIHGPKEVEGHEVEYHRYCRVQLTTTGSNINPFLNIYPGNIIIKDSGCHWAREGGPCWELEVVSGQVPGDDSPDLGGHGDPAVDLEPQCDVMKRLHDGSNPRVKQVVAQRPPLPGAVFNKPDRGIGRGIGQLSAILEPLAHSNSRLEQIGQHHPPADVDPAHSKPVPGLQPWPCEPGTPANCKRQDQHHATSVETNTSIAHGICGTV